MYVTTFYSFKGGVGRTMAMVNCAFGLSKNNRNVLLVDFDLEAPGVDAFLHPYGEQKSKGLVDFITDYRATRSAPHIADYVYESGPPGARLHIMPAGKRDDTYANRLNSIDWGQLYAEEDGYLLFEDLKAQWEEFISPDYVFIDSRTGHTDISGICTRQLPDSVVLLFRLDSQNLVGLQTVVQAIQKEREGPRQKNICINFVPSNVPNIDDEKQILKKQLEVFKDQLKTTHLDPMIRHYGDMEMLEHKIFTIERENSGLSKEYQQLLKSIIRQNPNDPDGAKDFLHTLLSPNYPQLYEQDYSDNQVETIASTHRSDPEILTLLARYMERNGRYIDAINYQSDAISAGPTTVENYTERGKLYRYTGNDELAKQDLSLALDSCADSAYSVIHLILMIRQMEPELFDTLPNSRAFGSLSVGRQIQLAVDFVSKSSIGAATTILKQVIETKDATSNEIHRARHELGILLIAQGSFDEAVELLANADGIRDTFNLAMAKWGSTGKIPKNEFEHVREFDNNNGKNKRNANYEFCLALTVWALGDNDSGAQRLRASRECLRGSQTLSPWRYQSVDLQDFRYDLDEAAQMLKGASVRPLVFQKTTWYKGKKSA